MKQKNIESIKALIEIARSEANHLQDSWFQILQCISHLEQLQLLGSGASPYQPEDDDVKPKQVSTPTKKPALTLPSLKRVPTFVPIRI
jgi:brefeldin A-inhibited guanine nucleotide-exchange protein